jgi:hypothetical protein
MRISPLPDDFLITTGRCLCSIELQWCYSVVDNQGLDAPDFMPAGSTLPFPEVDCSRPNLVYRESYKWQI